MDQRRTVIFDSADADSKVPTEEEIYKYRDNIVGFAHHLTGWDHATCEDIAQEAMEKTILYLRSRRLKGKDPLKPFMIVVTKNLCLDRVRRGEFRRKGLRIYSQMELSRSLRESVEEKGITNLRLTQVLDRIALMPRDQGISLLRRAQGFTDRETAVQLKKSRSAVISLVWRGRQELAKWDSDSTSVA